MIVFRCDHCGKEHPADKDELMSYLMRRHDSKEQDECRDCQDKAAEKYRLQQAKQLLEKNGYVFDGSKGGYVKDQA